MNSYKSLGSHMSRKEVEGSAPVQTLGHIDNDALEAEGLRAQDAYYPAKFEDNRDIDKESKMALKLSLDQDEWGVRHLDEGTVDYLYDKAKQQEMRNFDAWYATIFDHRDPAQLKLSREINPGWFDRRIKAIDESLDFQKKIARMNLMGIRNQEDVLTAYAIATGRIEPSLYNTNFMQPTQQTQDIRETQYIKGMFAPRFFDDYIKPTHKLQSATDPLQHKKETALIQGNVDLLSFKEMMKGETKRPIMTGALDARNRQNISGAENVTLRGLANLDRTQPLRRRRASASGADISGLGGILPGQGQGSGSIVREYQGGGE